MNSHHAVYPQPFNVQYEMVGAHLAEQRGTAAAIYWARQARYAGGTERRRRVLSVGRWAALIWTALFRFRAGPARGQAAK
ncbi:MAG TPA: hypothetical protein VNL71_24725 [Chloroflexota bacterium]|nr:hypothetical protein [Chloroflexota bacterium]